MANVSIRSYVRRSRKGGPVKVKGYTRRVGRKGFRNLAQKKRKNTAPGDEFKAKLEEMEALKNEQLKNEQVQEPKKEKSKPAYEGPFMTPEQAAAWDKKVREISLRRYAGYKSKEPEKPKREPRVRKRNKDIFDKVEDTIARFVEKRGGKYKRLL